MDFNDIGPLQLVVIGFGPDAEFEGLVLDELERLTARGLIRVIDLRFVTKGDDGDLLALSLSGLDDDQAAEFGTVIDRLIGLAQGAGDDVSQPEAGSDRSYGIGAEQLAELAAGLAPGDSVGMLLFEHTWAAELKAAIRTTGGFPIAQGFLTPEAAMMVGAEVRAIAEAEATMELADAVAGAAMLDAIAAVAAAEDIKAAAAVEAVQALIVAGLIVDAAADLALAALVEAELVAETAVGAAAELVAADQQASDEALAALAVAGDEDDGTAG
jgi:hypothetical protein